MAAARGAVTYPREDVLVVYGRVGFLFINLLRPDSGLISSLKNVMKMSAEPALPSTKRRSKFTW